jgi:hypothetical protein
VRATFFGVVTNAAAGLGPTYPGSGGIPVPIANTRIGFAFHQDPATGLPSGRYPNNPADFVHDLAEPGLQAWIAANGAPRYVQWDVVFDMQYRPGASNPPPLSPTTPRQALDFLRLPFRF